MHDHYNGRRANWKRVSRRCPCPVCGKVDWCLFSGPNGNPTAAICARIESDRCVGSEGAGWLHKLHDDHQWRDRPRQRRVTIEAPTDPPEFAAMVTKWYVALGPRQRIYIASQLGVSAESLDLMRVGWNTHLAATTWPMHGGDGRICGIRLRRPDGSKFSVRGSRNGIFIAHGRDPFGGDHALRGTLVIVEGATDAAAMLSIGIECVGRPSCSGGVDTIVEFCSPHLFNQVAIIADSDAPGQRGARYLASRLAGYSPQGVRIVTPPRKDIREWVNGGATRDDVLAAIDGAPVMRLSYSTKGGAA